MKRNVFTFFIAFFVSLLISLAYFCPNISYRVSSVSGEPTYVLTLDDIDGATNCTIDSVGTITPDANDAYIIFNNIKIKTRTVALKLSGKTDVPIDAQLYYSKKANTFNESDSCSAMIFCYGDTACFTLPEATYRFFRLDIDQKYSFSKLEFYDTDPVYSNSKVDVPLYRYVYAFISALIFAFVVFIIDYKTDFSKKFHLFLVKRRKKIFLYILGCLVCAAAAGVVESIIALIFAKGFLSYRYAFICGLFLCVYALLCCRRSVSFKPENAFLCLALIMGSVLIIVCPFFHEIWDNESHYAMTLGISSYKGIINATEADNQIIKHQTMNADFTIQGNSQRIADANASAKNGVAFQYYRMGTVAHIPAGIVVSVSKYLGLPFYSGYLLGKLANLLVYSFVCYFAIRKLQSGKMILTVLALMPTNLFLASNYSYDYWVTAFSMLGMACYVSELQQPMKPLAVNDTVLMCGAFAVASLPKLIYAPLLIMPFFIKKKCRFDMKKHVKICTLIIMVLGLLLLIKSFFVTKSGGDPRGGADAVGQIKYIIGNPLEYTGTLLKFLRGYVTFEQAANYSTNFAYLGIGKGAAFTIAMICVAAFTDKNEYDKYCATRVNRIITMLLYLGLSALIATALYIAFTPVGTLGINGCQNRYIIPLLYPVFAVIGSSRVLNHMGRKKYNYFFLSLSAIIFMYNVYYLCISKYV